MTNNSIEDATPIIWSQHKTAAAVQLFLRLGRLISSATYSYLQATWEGMHLENVIEKRSFKGKAALNSEITEIQNPHSMRVQSSATVIGYK